MHIACMKSKSYMKVATVPNTFTSTVSYSRPYLQDAVALGGFNHRPCPIPCTAPDEPESLEGKVRGYAYIPAIAIVLHLYNMMQATLSALISSTKMCMGDTTGVLSEPGQTASPV